MKAKVSPRSCDLRCYTWRPTASTSCKTCQSKSKSMPFLADFKTKLLKQDRWGTSCFSHTQIRWHGDQVSDIIRLYKQKLVEPIKLKPLNQSSNHVPPDRPSLSFFIFNIMRVEWWHHNEVTQLACCVCICSRCSLQGWLWHHWSCEHWGTGGC